jgi:hypothetical protein
MSPCGAAFVLSRSERRQLRLTRAVPTVFPANMNTGNNPPRRRKNDRSEVPVSFLPVGNPAARRAYLFALVGLIPGLGIICGLPATVFAVIGSRAALKDDERRGRGHAYISRILGPIEFVCSAAGLVCLAKAMDLF